MKYLKKILYLVVIVCLTPMITLAETLPEVADEAATYFIKSAIQIPHGQPLYIMSIVNARSKRNDETAKKIENELFLALERQKPDFKLFLVREAAAEDDVYLTGSYEPKGENTLLYLRIVKGIVKPRILAQFQREFISERMRQRTLVAVLDLEAESLESSAKKAFSEVFRSSLSREDVFDFVSSADIDKLDPEAIQKNSGCTRDECATIIGEQLGVDRVISTSLLKIEKELFVLSGKIFNIQDGAILKARTVKHTGGIDSLDHSFEKLALALVSDKEPAGKKEPLIVQEESEEERDRRFGGEMERLAKARFRDGENKSDAGPTSKNHRDDSIFFIGITPVGLHKPTVVTHPFVFGIYIGTGLQIGVESGTASFSNDIADATAIHRSVFVRLFPGGSFNFLLAVNERIWSAEANTISSVPVTAMTTKKTYTYGIGNQWITDSGVTIGGDWVFFTQESDSETIYSANYAGNPAAQAAFADLSMEEDLFATGIGAANFTIGFSF